MIFDTKAITDTKVLLYASSLISTDETPTTSTAIAVDTHPSEGCVVSINIGAMGNVVVSDATANDGIVITLQECDTEDGTYTDIPTTKVLGTDIVYTTSWVIPLTEAQKTAGKKLIRFGLIHNKRWLQMTITNPGGTAIDGETPADPGAALLVSINAELARPQYVADFFAQDVRPTQV